MKLSLIGILFLLCSLPFNKAKAEMIYDVAGKVELGTIKSADQIYLKSSSMLNYGIEGFVGYKYQFDPAYSLFAGVNPEFLLMRQTSDPATVGGTNIYGTNFIAGLAVGAEYGRYKLLLSYDFLSRFSLGANTAYAQTSSFKSGAGLRAELKYNWNQQYFVGINFGYLAYSTQILNGADLDLSANTISLLTYGLSLGYQF